MKDYRGKQRLVEFFPNEPTIFAVTVNWNRSEDTLECVDSLIRQQRSPYRIVVVDNGSYDNSVEIIREHFPSVEIIRSDTNLYYAGGANLGIQHAIKAGADFVLLINNDATLASSGLELLLKYTHDTNGIVAPLIYYSSDPKRIWSAGGITNKWNLEKKGDYNNHLDNGEWPEYVERDFVTGCCFLVSRKCIEQVGLFDENLTMYYEDSDYCWRVRKSGLSIRVVPAAHAWHKISMSSGGRDSPNERYWMARSSLFFFRKHARGIQKPIVILWRTGSALVTTLRLARRRRWSSLWGYWRGLLDGYRHTCR